MKSEGGCRCDGYVSILLAIGILCDRGLLWSLNLAVCPVLMQLFCGRAFVPYYTRPHASPRCILSGVIPRHTREHTPRECKVWRRQTEALEQANYLPTEPNLFCKIHGIKREGRGGKEGRMLSLFLSLPRLAYRLFLCEAVSPA